MWAVVFLEGSRGDIWEGETGRNWVDEDPYKRDGREGDGEENVFTRLFR